MQLLVNFIEVEFIVDSGIWDNFNFIDKKNVVNTFSFFFIVYYYVENIFSAHITLINSLGEQLRNDNKDRRESTGGFFIFTYNENSHITSTKLNFDFVS